MHYTKVNTAKLFPSHGGQLMKEDHYFHASQCHNTFGLPITTFQKTCKDRA